MSFEITNELLANITSYIEASNDKPIIALFEEMHYADVAEILDELSFDDVIYITSASGFLKIIKDKIN